MQLERKKTTRANKADNFPYTTCSHLHKVRGKTNLPTEVELEFLMVEYKTQAIQTQRPMMDWVSRAGWLAVPSSGDGVVVAVWLANPIQSGLQSLLGLLDIADQVMYIVYSVMMAD